MRRDHARSTAQAVCGARVRRSRSSHTGDRVEIGLHRDVVGERDHVADQHGKIGAERVERETDLELARVTTLALYDLDGRDPEQVTRERAVA